ncbi:MAG: hypothetical protein HPY82_05860 [Gammaproteobacteria bacterium]|nr:hypothetical protein [Gammaproteobacteria bacterium]
MITLHQAVESVGGPEQAASHCGVSKRAVYKWLARKRLPRTEYTGETNYAEILADKAIGLNFTKEELLNSLKSVAA